jgi:hypothetical protein
MPVDPPWQALEFFPVTDLLLGHAGHAASVLPSIRCCVLLTYRDLLI